MSDWILIDEDTSCCEATELFNMATGANISTHPCDTHISLSFNDKEPLEIKPENTWFEPLKAWFDAKVAELKGRTAENEHEFYCMKNIHRILRRSGPTFERLRQMTAPGKLLHPLVRKDGKMNLYEVIKVLNGIKQ